MKRWNRSAATLAGHFARRINRIEALRPEWSSSAFLIPYPSGCHVNLCNVSKSRDICMRSVFHLLSMAIGAAADARGEKARNASPPIISPHNFSRFPNSRRALFQVLRSPRLPIHFIFPRRTRSKPAPRQVYFPHSLQRSRKKKVLGQVPVAKGKGDRFDYSCSRDGCLRVTDERGGVV